MLLHIFPTLCDSDMAMWVWHIQVFLCIRWRELKKGWRRRKGSLHSSRGSSTVGSRCEFLRRLPKSFLMLLLLPHNHLYCPLRNDEKTAADYKIQGGSVLHLVLALRGGSATRHCSTHLLSSWEPPIAITLALKRKYLNFAFFMPIYSRGRKTTFLLNKKKKSESCALLVSFCE